MATYPNNPIQEAIFDVHVVGSPLSALEIDDGFQAVRPRFPKRQEVVGAPNFQFKATQGEPPSLNFGSALRGFRYASEDENSWFEARVDGFSFNRLAPYSTWEEFSTQAKELWQTYIAVSRPQVVTRIGLRYINHLSIPLGEEQMVIISDYLTTFPVWPNALSDMEGFNLQIASPQSDIEATLLLTVSTLSSTEMGEPQLLLDIDLFHQTLNLKIDDAATFWTIANTLRERKNMVFEQCIKDKARILIR